MSSGKSGKFWGKHRLAAKRRAWVRQEDERREESSRDHWTANIRGMGVFRGRGQFETGFDLTY